MSGRRTWAPEGSASSPSSRAAVASSHWHASSRLLSTFCSACAACGRVRTMSVNRLPMMSWKARVCRTGCCPHFAAPAPPAGECTRCCQLQCQLFEVHRSTCSKRPHSPHSAGLFPVHGTSACHFSEKATNVSQTRQPPASCIQLPPVHINTLARQERNRKGCERFGTWSRAKPMSTSCSTSAGSARPPARCRRRAAGCHTAATGQQLQRLAT